MIYLTIIVRQLQKAILRQNNITFSKNNEVMKKEVRDRSWWQKRLL